jgi:hypothetical protein
VGMQPGAPRAGTTDGETHPSVLVDKPGPHISLGVAVALQKAL